MESHILLTRLLRSALQVMLNLGLSRLLIASSRNHLLPVAEAIHVALVLGRYANKTEEWMCT